MRFAYYDRLSAARQRVYRRSDEIGALGLPPDAAPGALVLAVGRALADEQRLQVQRASQSLMDMLTDGYRVPRTRVRVLTRRPLDGDGELHGLYEPEDGNTGARITVWMRTAHHRRVVAFRTFLRTLVHELCHHLDYELFALAETFHTEGFYRRESSLASALLSSAGETGGHARPPGEAKARRSLV